MQGRKTYLQNEWEIELGKAWLNELENGSRNMSTNYIMRLR